MKKESIIIYSITVLLALNVFMPTIIHFIYPNMYGGETSEYKRKQSAKRLMHELFNTLNEYIYINKEAPKSILDLLAFSKKEKLSFEEYYKGQDTINKYFGRPLKFIKIYEIPKKDSDSITEKVTKDLNIAYYIKQDKRFVIIGVYIINSYGQFLSNDKGIISENDIIPIR